LLFCSLLLSSAGLRAAANAQLKVERSLCRR